MDHSVAFIVVILLVNLIRTRSFDYAWRIAIVAGGVVYILVVLGGGVILNLNIDMINLIVYTVVSVVVGLLLEFFVFGRRLQPIQRDLSMMMMSTTTM